VGGEGRKEYTFWAKGYGQWGGGEVGGEGRKEYTFWAKGYGQWGGGGWEGRAVRSAPSGEAVLAGGAEELEVLAPVVHQAVLLVIAHLARVVRRQSRTSPPSAWGGRKNTGAAPSGAPAQRRQEVPERPTTHDDTAAENASQNRTIL